MHWLRQQYQLNHQGHPQKLLTRPNEAFYVMTFTLFATLQLSWYILKSLMFNLRKSLYVIFCGTLHSNNIKYAIKINIGASVQDAEPLPLYKGFISTGVCLTNCGYDWGCTVQGHKQKQETHTFCVIRLKSHLNSLEIDIYEQCIKYRNT